MANTTKYTVPGRSPSSVSSPVATGSVDSLDVRLSPRLQALRKLVASGQYQVSQRYLAHKIMRAAGFRPE